MTTRRAVWLILRRELAERLRQRSLAVSSGVTLLLVLAIAIVPGLGHGSTRYRVGLVGPSTAPLAAALQRVARAEHVLVVTQGLANRSRADRRLAAGALDAAVDGTTVIVEKSLATRLEAIVQLANRDVRIQQALAVAGVSGAHADAIVRPPPLRTLALHPPDPKRNSRLVLVTVGVFLVFGQIVGYGFAVATSVVEEKSSRVVELVLAKIRARELLAGKILGVGCCRHLWMTTVWQV